MVMNLNVLPVTVSVGLGALIVIKIVGFETVKIYPIGAIVGVSSLLPVLVNAFVTSTITFP